MSHQIQMTGALAPREDWVIEGCPIAATLEIVSTRSAFLILREAFYGATRFEQFVERAQISEPVAAARLRELTDAGLLAREPYRDPGQRTRSEYRLTDKGADLAPTLIALMDWGDRWGIDGGARVELRHAGCGAPVHVELRCTEGHEVVAGEIELGLKRPD
ncbi:MAG: winged helix-turn-helix transcriptional regulator [Solirubrobacteraceae bacterium]